MEISGFFRGKLKSSNHHAAAGAEKKEILMKEFDLQPADCCCRGFRLLHLNHTCRRRRRCCSYIGWSSFCFPLTTAGCRREEPPDDMFASSFSYSMMSFYAQSARFTFLVIPASASGNVLACLWRVLSKLPSKTRTNGRLLLLLLLKKSVKVL